MTPLTEQMILNKTKSDSIKLIKALNMWGNDIDDIQILKEMPFLETICLSVNKISSLRPLSSLFNLKELYLRKNNIEDINELQYLQTLPNLKKLWLNENPCTLMPNYRQFVITILPQVENLDESEITPEEREQVYLFQQPKQQQINQQLLLQKQIQKENEQEINVNQIQRKVQRKEVLVNSILNLIQLLTKDQLKNLQQQLKFQPFN